MLLSLRTAFLTTALVASAAAAYAQDVANGKELFVKNTCYGCHGFSGQNGPGNRLVPMRMNQAAFIAYVRKPSSPERMPTYSAKVLSDEQLGDIYAYIRSLPNAPAARDIPLLNQIKNSK